jgi:TonB family protein
MKAFALAIIAVASVGPLRAQQLPSTDLLAVARAQIARRQLDSATTRLEQVAYSGAATGPDRGEAFIWLGVVQFYRGQDSAADSSFRAALATDRLLLPRVQLAALDPDLGAMWERDQTAALCGEQLPAWYNVPIEPHGLPLNAAARAAREPTIRPDSVEPLRYPEHLLSAGVQGRVIVRVIIDSLGRVDPGSQRIITTPDVDLEYEALTFIMRLHYRPARQRDRPIRSCRVAAVDFKINQ